MKRKKKNQFPDINIEDTESNESEGLKTEKKKRKYYKKSQIYRTTIRMFVVWIP